MKMLLSLLFSSVLMAGMGTAQEAPQPEPAPKQALAEASAAHLRWTESDVEHLLNRAGFGAPDHVVKRWQKAGPDALIEHLFNRGGPAKPFVWQAYRINRAAREAATPDERIEMDRAVRGQDQQQLRDFNAWWIQEMTVGRDPLRERMTLILHGWLVSSNDKVRQSDYLIQQNALFRSNALGNYGHLLREILKDPAMLLYLDNTTNRKAKPNENLARELLELFSLGEGNYTEGDVKQAARALTGYTVNDQGYHYNIRQHDPRFKTVLGKSSRMAADGLVAVILEQEACARYVAKRLITEFEGVAPEADRWNRYAQLLRTSNYELEPFLRALFADPDFYREEVVGAKVLSPVEFMVGHCRRLAVKPDSGMIYQAASLLGQNLLRPPSVKGWDGGFAWLTESSMMLRSNVWGGVLGQITPQELNAQVAEAIEMMDEMMDEMEMEELDTGEEVGQQPKRRGGPLPQLLYAIQKRKLTVDVPILERLQKARAFSDKQIADYLLDQLLAIEAPEVTRAAVTQYIKQERKALKIQAGKLHKGGARAKSMLLRTIHLVLSLPEANLG